MRIHNYPISLPVLAVVLFCAMPAPIASAEGFLDAVTNASSELPAPSKGYTPPQSLPATTAQLWDLITEVLDKNRIAVASAAKNEWRINTDYVAGPHFSAMFGLLGSNSTRYKYQIRLKPVGRATKVLVTAVVESSGSNVQAWRDVSADNRQVVADLEAWLIEQIETQLKATRN